MRTDGWAMAIRACRLMIEQRISPGPERDGVLSHLDPNASPLDEAARSIEEANLRANDARRVAAQMWAALRRYERTYPGTLTPADRDLFNHVLNPKGATTP